jgi:hypothetical protein
MEDCFKSAENTTCDSCKLLRDLAEHWNVTEEPDITVSRGSDGKGLEVSILADLDEDDVMLDLFVPEGEESGHPLIGPQPGVRKVSFNSSDEDCILGGLKFWMDDCYNNHDNCESDKMPLPTRVIDVGLDGKEPFLVEPGDVKEWYATLSYCWGKTPQLRLTKERLEEFKKKIPMDQLSRVARDAIEICQKVSIPYLWIDALCIVQDDEADWEREAGHMCDVYSSSSLTIAAAGAADNSEGIYQYQHFGEESRVAAFPFRDQLVYARFNPFQDHLGHPLGLNFDDQYADRVAESSWLLRAHEIPLVQRAWTVQERILSRKIVYFTKEEIWWECDSYWRCECGFADEEKYSEESIAALKEDLRSVKEANRGSFDWLRDRRRIIPMTLEDAYSKWGTIATMFAGGELTFAADKLPALSGLAQQFKRMLKSRFDFDDFYYAGMWRHQLERQLLWVVANHVPGLKTPTAPPQKSSIPTWSWMAATGNVQYISDPNDLNYKPRFRILDVSTELVGEDWSGRIKGGRLTIEGHIRHGIMLSRPRDPHSPTVRIDIPDTDKFTSVNKDTGAKLHKGSYSCFYAADMSSAEEGPIDKPDLEAGNMFFLLRPVENKPGEYERVGMGLAALHYATEGLWEKTEKEIITIV